MPCGMEVGLGQGDSVLDGDPALLPQKGGPSPHPKMALGMEVGLGTGRIVLDGDPATLPKKGAEYSCPIFGPFLLWTNGWMHQDVTWYGGS